MARKPCKRCQQVRMGTLVLMVVVLIGYSLLKTAA
ncbi:MAG: hypothetical protein ACI9RY_000117 [Reinekea sp.]|jgi:hypothetical protein